MITSPFTVLRPTAPGVAPGTAVLAGPAGASAYAIWLAAGNTGTLGDFLASLVGPPPTAAQIQAAIQALMGQPSGIAGLDNKGRQPLAQDQIRAWQVTRVARAMLIALGNSWSGFVASTGPDDPSGLYEAIQGGTPAPPGGILATQLTTYLVTSCGQSQAQAAATVQTIWAQAATIAP